MAQGPVISNASTQGGPRLVPIEERELSKHAHRSPIANSAAEQPIAITTREEYERLAPGRIYIAPDDVISKKRWIVTDFESYRLVPPGHPYIDPQGRPRIKANYDNVVFPKHNAGDSGGTNIQSKGHAHEKAASVGSQVQLISNSGIVETLA